MLRFLRTANWPRWPKGLAPSRAVEINRRQHEAAAFLGGGSQGDHQEIVSNIWRSSSFGTQPMTKSTPAKPGQLLGFRSNCFAQTKSGAQALRSFELLKGCFFLVVPSHPVRNRLLIVLVSFSWFSGGFHLSHKLNF